MEKSRRKKNDFILIGVLIVVALLSLIGLRLYSKVSTKDAEAVVIIEGAESGRYPINKDLEVKIESKNGGYNLLRIKDGKAEIPEASCPDKVCVNHRPVAKNGETLVCLPNEVVVEIVNGEEAEVDTSTH